MGTTTKIDTRKQGVASVVGNLRQTRGTLTDDTLLVLFLGGSTEVVPTKTGYKEETRTLPTKHTSKLVRVTEKIHSHSTSTQDQPRHGKTEWVFGYFLGLWTPNVCTEFN